MITVNITIPCYNEENIISSTIDQVINYCEKKLLKYNWNVIIADNGSEDRTLLIVQEKIKKYSNLKFFSLKNPGKGIAIKESWLKYSADINIFMDADLATDLNFIPSLIEPIKKKRFDLVIGSRRQKESKIERSLLRSFISNIYNFIVKILFNLKITDFSCGFKSCSKKVVKDIIPKTKNNGFFFDTELLILSYYYGFNIKEVPIIWKDDKNRKTKVKIFKTSFNYLKKLLKLKRRIIYEKIKKIKKGR